MTSEEVEGLEHVEGKRGKGRELRRMWDDFVGVGKGCGG